MHILCFTMLDYTIPVHLIWGFNYDIASYIFRKALD